MEIELFNTWEESWNRIPDMELKDISKIGFSVDWDYYIWGNSIRSLSVIRVRREE